MFSSHTGFRRVTMVVHESEDRFMMRQGKIFFQKVQFKNEKKKRQLTLYVK